MVLEPKQVGSGRMRRLSRLGIVFLAILSTRLALVLVPPSGFFHNTDELGLTLSAVDRLLGLPSVSLSWPSSTLQLLFLPLLLLDFLLSKGMPTNTGAFASSLSGYLSQCYLDPRHQILLMRYEVAALSSLAAILLYKWLRGSGSSKLGGLFGAGLLLVAPDFVRYCTMAAGEALSITFVIAAMATLANAPSKTRSMIAGTLSACAIAAKFNGLGLALLPLTTLLFARPDSIRRQRWILAGWWCLGVGIGALVACPYLWVDPIRLTKSVVGNLTRSGDRAGLSILFGLLCRPKNIPLLCAALLGVGSLLASRRRKDLVAPAIALVLIIGPLLRAGVVYPRYFLPALPIIILLAVHGIETIRLHVMRFRWGSSWTAILAMAILLPQVAATVRAESMARTPNARTQIVEFVKREGPNTTIYLPDEFFDDVKANASRSTLESVATRARSHILDGSRTARFLADQGLPVEPMTLLITNFNEDEQCWLARSEAMKRAASETGLSLHFYSAPNVPSYALRSPVAEYSFEAALADFQRQTNSIFVSRQPILNEKQLDHVSTTDWFAYRR